MRQDEIEKVFSELTFYLKTHRKLRFEKGFIFTLYRGTTGNYSPTSFREFVLSAKSLGVLKEIRPNVFIFDKNYLDKYVELKKGFK